MVATASTSSGYSLHVEILDSMNDQDIQISFEFFPPKTDAGREKLVQVRNSLKEFAPSYYSVTYGAGGSTRDNTKDIILQYKQDGFDVAPHLSFGGDCEETILALLPEGMSPRRATSLEMPWSE